jgi:hypothetical protein
MDAGMRRMREASRLRQTREGWERQADGGREGKKRGKQMAAVGEGNEEAARQERGGGGMWQDEEKTVWRGDQASQGWVYVDSTSLSTHTVNINNISYRNLKSSIKIFTKWFYSLSLKSSKPFLRIPKSYTSNVHCEKK